MRHDTTTILLAGRFTTAFAAERTAPPAGSLRYRYRELANQMARSLLKKKDATGLQCKVFWGYFIFRDSLECH
ncbi:MAG: hypothetical protein ACP5O7_08025 [Phycisphaerae bacterium]